MNSKYLQTGVIVAVYFEPSRTGLNYLYMTLAQLSGRNSLRDIVDNMFAQAHQFFHLGVFKLICSNLFQISEEKPFTLYETLFFKVLVAAKTLGLRWF